MELFYELLDGYRLSIIYTWSVRIVDRVSRREIILSRYQLRFYFYHQSYHNIARKMSTQAARSIRFTHSSPQQAFRLIELTPDLLELISSPNAPTYVLETF